VPVIKPAQRQKTILTGACYKASTKTQNTKTIKIHKNKTQKKKQK
jgi:hypothetical protein